MVLLSRLTLLLALISIASIRVIAQSCEKLIHYRDVELVDQFDAARKKYEINYRIINEAIVDAKSYKESVLSEKGWDEFMSAGTAMSDGGAKAAQIASIIKTYCDLFSGVMEMMPAEHIAATAVKKVKLTVEQTYSFIKAGKDLKEIVEGNLETIGYKYALDEMNIAGKATKTAMEFYENLNKLIEISEQKEELKSTVKRILDIADDAILKYKQKLEKSKAELNEQISIEQGTTKYIKENCKNFDSKKRLQNSKPKELSKVEKPLIIKNAKKIGNLFYIFLTTSIEIKPKASQFSSLQSSKTIFIISKPLSHEGSLTDDMLIEKSLFIADLEKHFINESDVIKEIRNKAMEIHYGKPFSTEISKTSVESYKAIEAYKNSIKETLEGLAQFDFLEF